MDPIDYLARFWQSIFYSSQGVRGIGPPPVSAEIMAWLTLIGGILGIIMFIDWLYGKFKKGE